MKKFLRSKLVLTLGALVLLGGVIAISLSGNILHSHAATTATVGQWTIVPSSGTGILWAVSAISDSDVWAVGADNNNHPQIEQCSATNCKVVSNPAETRTGQLYAVTAISANDVWACGYTTKGAVDSGLMMHWNGTNWSIVSTTPASQFTGISADASNDVWAVAQETNVNEGNNAIQHWDGTTWSGINNTNNFPYGSVVAFASNNVWTLGVNTAHWDGHSWSVMSQNPDNVTSITGTSSANLWGIGNSNATIYQFVNNAWSEFETGTGTFSSNSISMPSQTFGMAVGTYTNNVSFAQMWNGTSWVNTKPLAGNSPTINGVTALTGNTAWAVGYLGNGTLIEHYTQGSPVRQKLFILLQGINSTLDSSHAKNNTDTTFWQMVNNIPGIAPFLKNNGYSKAKFLEYSYTGYNGTGNPMPYTCLNTFTNPLVTDIKLLGGQIVSALQNNPNTDIYLIGHSLGGVIALGYEIALLQHSGIVPPLPFGAALKGVITLDSPIGGVSDNPNYFGLVSFIFTHGPYACKGLTAKQMYSVKNLVAIYQTAPTSHLYQGANASILQAILQGQALTNETVAKQGVLSGISALTIGNTNDLLWRPSLCYTDISDFMSTQWVDDMGNQSGIYGRDFTDGVLACFKGIPWQGVNHSKVLNNAMVEQGLIQFLPNGGTPSALAVAPAGP